MEMFATGKITTTQMVSLLIGVPKAHQTSLTGTSTWDKDASIIENLQDWSDKLDITPYKSLNF